MKKSKFLVLALAVAVMLMGAGYAYWTQELTITNTIDTGNLDVIFASPSLSLPTGTYMKAGSFNITDPQKPYGLALVLNDAYPGADFTISFNLQNTGTLGACVRDFAIVQGESDYGDPELILVKSYKIGSNSTVTPAAGTTLEDVLETINSINNGNKGGNGVFLGTKDNNETVNLVFNLEIDPENANNDTLEQNNNKAISFTINSTAHQYNK